MPTNMEILMTVYLYATSLDLLVQPLQLDKSPRDIVQFIALYETSFVDSRSTSERDSREPERGSEERAEEKGKGATGRQG